MYPPVSLDDVIHVLRVLVLGVLGSLPLLHVHRPNGTLGQDETLQRGKGVAELGDLAPELDGVAGKVELLQRRVTVLGLVAAKFHRLVFVQGEMKLLQVAKQTYEALDRRPGDAGAVEHEVTQRVVLAILYLVERFFS